MKFNFLVLISIFFYVLSCNLSAQTEVQRDKKNSNQEMKPTNDLVPAIDRDTNKKLAPVTDGVIIPDNKVKELEDKTRKKGKTNDVTDKKKKGEVNWTEQYIEATGMSAIDEVKFKNKGRAYAMARRGAIVVAQRNLLEIVKGVNITGETTVRDMITEKDYIYSRIEGVIKGAEMVGQPQQENGLVIVKMRIKIYSKRGIAPIIDDELPNVPDIKPSNKEEQRFGASNNTNKAIAFSIKNSQGKSVVSPSMFPKFYDENGKLVLDLRQYYDPKKGVFPKILSTTKELMQASGIDYGKNVIEAIENYDGKLVIDSKSKGKINWLKIGKGIINVAKILFL